MTTDTALVTDEVTLAADAAGLAVEPLDPGGLAAVEGPLITMDLAGPDGAVVATVAVSDDRSGADDLLASLGPTLGAWAGQGGTPTSADPVPDGSDIAARFTTPFEAVGLSDDGTVVAALVRAVDRRGATAAAPAGPSSEPGVATPSATSGAAAGLDKLSNVNLEVSVELGRCTVTLAEVLSYDVGSVVELDRAVGAPVDVRVNGTLLARGEVVLIDDEYAVRITDVLEPGSR